MKIEKLTPVVGFIYNEENNKIVYGRFFKEFPDFFDIILENGEVICVGYVKELTEEQYMMHMRNAENKRIMKEYKDLNILDKVRGE